MSETQSEPSGDMRPMTFRNWCSAGCGREHSPAGKAPAVMVPDIGFICAECIPAGAAEFIKKHPQKFGPIPYYGKREEV